MLPGGQEVGSGRSDGRVTTKREASPGYQAPKEIRKKKGTESTREELRSQRRGKQRRDPAWEATSPMRTALKRQLPDHS